MTSLREKLDELPKVANKERLAEIDSLGGLSQVDEKKDVKF